MSQRHWQSHLLELIAACAHKLGLSPGVEIPRGDPFADRHDFSLHFYIATGTSQAIDQGLQNDAVFPDWDRTLIDHVLVMEAEEDALCHDQPSGPAVCAKALFFAIRLSTVVQAM